MEIVGYSERGAMNALFYGIALNRDEKAANEAMNVFLNSLCQDSVPQILSSRPRTNRARPLSFSLKQKQVPVNVTI